MHDSIFAWAADRLNQAFCAMRGHDPYLHFEEDRLYLQCNSCGHASPGWAIGKTHARVEVEPTRRPLVRLPLFGRRAAFGARRAV